MLPPSSPLFMPPSSSMWRCISIVCTCDGDERMSATPFMEAVSCKPGFLHIELSLQHVSYQDECWRFKDPTSKCCISGGSASGLLSEGLAAQSTPSVASAATRRASCPKPVSSPCITPRSSGRTSGAAISSSSRLPEMAANAQELQVNQPLIGKHAAAGSRLSTSTIAISSYSAGG